MLERKPKSMVGTSGLAGQNQQSHQSSKLLLALVILLVGIAVLLVADRDFWFGSSRVILDSDGTESAAARQTSPTPSAVQHHVQHQQQAAPAPAKTPLSAATSTKPNNSAGPAVTTSRSVLPPLDVEVIAGNAHRTVDSNTSHSNTSHSNTPKIEIESAAPNAAAMTNAAGREPISAEDTPQASYPLLAQHMNVQGSVVLKAVIGADGIIEDIRVLSGPAILAAAAQQAVREWHFKPVVQNGQPVETMAKIVVNFTIKVTDNSEKTTLAESRADSLLIFTR